MRFPRLFALLLFSLFLPLAAEAADAPPWVTPTASLDDALRTGRVNRDTLDTITRRSGAKVLVELELGIPYRPEPTLDDAAQQAQRAAIAAAQSAVIKQLAGLVPATPRRLRTIAYLSSWLDARGLAVLAASRHVRRILPVTRSAPQLTASSEVTGAAPAQRALGLLGAGQTVAIVDTGVERSHPFFGGRVRFEACYSSEGFWLSGQYSLCPSGDTQAEGPGTAAPCSGFASCDHGTHVAGIAAGGGNGSARFSGVANLADILAFQVFHREDHQDDCGLTPAPCLLADSDDIVLALERIYDLRNAFAIAAVNLSLGSGAYDNRVTCDDENDPYRDAIANLVGAGIAVVAASGNDAAIRDAQMRIIGFRTGIAAPACVTGVISVGNHDNSRALVQTSQFGSLLTMLSTGANITSSISGARFAPKGGTSMAAPTVAGAFAALASLSPASTLSQRTARLLSTGVPVTDAHMLPALVRPSLRLDAALEQQLQHPLTPTLRSLQLATGTTARVEWLDNARSETSFRVHATLPGAVAPVRTDTVASPAPQGTVTRLTPNVSYDITVQACDAHARCSPPTNPLRVRTPNTLPSAPTNVRACNVTTTSIELCWDSQSVNPITDFRVGHNTASTGTWTSKQAPATARTATFTNLTPNRRYDFWVQAINADGPSSMVNFGTSTLSLGPPPAAPTNLHLCGSQGLELACVGIGSGTQFTWADVATNETFYEFQVARALVGVLAGQEVYIAYPLPADSRDFRISLTSDAYYRFRVRACNEAGCSGFSNILGLTAN